MQVLVIRLIAEQLTAMFNICLSILSLLHVLKLDTNSSSPLFPVYISPSFSQPISNVSQAYSQVDLVILFITLKIKFLLNLA